MRKKTYFIGVTHEIDGIVNYSIEFLVGVKFLEAILLKSPNIRLGFYLSRILLFYD